ncbi:MAG TPA: CoB--CoM heterodisulfide reductase subunit B [Candidatus Wirthbacteria bacterium]|nr:CoB--CoM heterodisulfide reductase subunit B [Candidatus Wirthbacteria bacterium]
MLQQHADQNSISKPNRYAFFRGCNIPVRIPHLEAVARLVFQKVGIELIDLNFGCCPFVGSVRDVSDLDWLKMAALNLVLAEEVGLPIISLCTGCTMTLVEAKHRLEDKETRAQVNAELAKAGKEYQGKVKVEFFAQTLYANQENWQELITHPLDLRVATHSGCHVLRPSAIMQFDDADNPHKLDDLVNWLGAQAWDYDKKIECCGGLAFAPFRDKSLNLLRQKIQSMAGAECLTVVCPTCFTQYDRNQRLLGKELAWKQMPVLHYLQLLGLALGFSVDEMLIKQNRSCSKEFVGLLEEVVG